MTIVLAIPTIAARPGLAEETAERWRELTPGRELEVVVSTAGASWGDGLNDIYQQTRDAEPGIFLCGSDDMVPAAADWLPTLEPWLKRGVFPVPRVSDPRFENYGGPDHPAIEVDNGTPTFMSTFPILRGDWLDVVFPLPGGLHYFADNWISAMLHLAGVEAVAVPSCRIVHLHAEEGRGAGYGSENTRLHVDTVRYTRALQERDIDRLALPKALRGHMWQERYHAVGVELGA